MTGPHIAQRSPYAVEVKEGQTIAWCACGKSQKQPYCDGSHAGTGMAPVIRKAEKAGTLYLCGCKHTKNQPFCDGTHSKLP